MYTDTIADKAKAAAVWGEYALKVGQAGCWKIGELRVWARRGEREWQVAHLPGGRLGGDSVHAEVPSSDFAPPDDAERLRLVFRQSSPVIRFSPALADRPIVVRSQTPLRLMPKESAQLFVTTPLWVRIDFAGSSGSVLDVPSVRLSDTWFGASTREGQLCYAGRVDARLRLEELVRVPYRVLTVFVVENRDAESLALDKIALPLPHLSLHREPGGAFWTQSVQVQRAKNGGEIEVRLNARLPVVTEHLELVAPPRKRIERNSALKALQVLMG
ncbi:MAG TPA: hypothetical protein VMY42_14790 [Thermoguttaceae bacterium]|nr:hypothetical protein [Thermoguttaceae bacterium]